MAFSKAEATREWVGHRGTKVTVTVTCWPLLMVPSGQVREAVSHGVARLSLMESRRKVPCRLAVNATLATLTSLLVIVLLSIRGMPMVATVACGRLYVAAKAETVKLKPFTFCTTEAEVLPGKVVPIAAVDCAERVTASSQGCGGGGGDPSAHWSG